MGVGVEVVVLLGLEEEPVGGVEDQGGELDEELFEETACVVSFLLVAEVGDEDDADDGLEVGDLGEGLVAVLEELGAADADLLLLDEVVFLEVGLDELLEEGGADFEGDAFGDEGDYFLDFGEELLLLNDVFPVEFRQIP